MPSAVTEVFVPLNSYIVEHEYEHEYEMEQETR